MALQVLVKIKIIVCRNPGSNQGPLDLQSNALPTELFRPHTILFGTVLADIHHIKNDCR